MLLSFPATRLLPAATARSLASSVLPAGLRSLQLSVGDGVSLHAVAPTPPTGADEDTRMPVLCLPPAFASVESAFAPQLNSTELTAKYAFVGVDPRGYGGSRPPERDFTGNWFERDADDMLRVADALELEQFSVLGWSAGANVAAVLAAKAPERVERLVLVNGNAFVSDEDMDAMMVLADVGKWTRARRAAGEAVYGAENLQTKWTEMLEALRRVESEEGGDLYCGRLPYIKCKTLVVAGGQDDMVADFHGEYLSERIMHSRREVLADGRHDLVLSSAERFNTLLDTFLQEPDDKLTQSREFVAVPSN